MNSAKPNKPVFIIAEAGVNHNGSLEQAKQLIEVAVEARADAVKFQTFRAELLASETAPLAEYQSANLGKKQVSQLEMLKALELRYQDYVTLKAHADRLGIEFLSTPFDLESFRFLHSELKLKKIKLSSGDLLNAPLLLEISQTGVNLIVSTGMANLEEIQESLGVLAFGYLKSIDASTLRISPSKAAFSEAFRSPLAQQALREKITLLHCTTEYPAPIEDVNLRAMITMRDHFGLRVGYSDHTLGHTTAGAAAALGATMIEKHFTLDKNQEGPDHKCSLEPSELKEFVTNIRTIEEALGSSEKKATASEMKNITICRKSVMASTAIKKGEIFTEQNITTKRPATGASSLLYWDFVGKAAPKDFKTNELVYL